MLPIGDENTCKRGSAPLTWTLIALNVAVFVFFQRFGSDLERTLALAVLPSELAQGRGYLRVLTASSPTPAWPTWLATCSSWGSSETTWSAG